MAKKVNSFGEVEDVLTYDETLRRQHAEELALLEKDLREGCVTLEDGTTAITERTHIIGTSLNAYRICIKEEKHFVIMASSEKDALEVARGMNKLGAAPRYRKVYKPENLGIVPWTDEDIDYIHEELTETPWQRK